MNEDSRRKYLSESRLSPSEELADRVMDEITFQKVPQAEITVKQNHWGFTIACALFLTLGAGFSVYWSEMLSTALETTVSVGFIQAMILGVTVLGVHLYRGLMRLTG
ncbi:MAG TPA: hypothetical protein DCE41_11060 [Cytophagales bacterium]|nr:hypothetical protein [Cytophagales bacterium]HAA20067.1 hypothetical protein [Cytophagales bacterium]HAP62525.1 hypothetical protein [Cytophagales bacterium]